RRLRGALRDQRRPAGPAAAGRRLAADAARRPGPPGARPPAAVGRDHAAGDQRPARRPQRADHPPARSAGSGAAAAAAEQRPVGAGRRPPVGRDPLRDDGDGRRPRLPGRRGPPGAGPVLIPVARHRCRIGAPMTPSDLEALEHDVLERLADEDGHLEADLEAAEGPDAPGEEEPEHSPLRPALAMAFPAIAAAVMAGGVFIGFEARIDAAVAAVLGVALAVGAARFRSPLAANAVIVGGLFGIGLLMVVPSGLGNVASVGRLASQASASGDVLRPPVVLTPGWQAILGWLLGIAGISVPASDQVASGLAVLVLFAVGLGVLSGAQIGSGPGEAVTSGTRRSPGLPAGYELRRALRAVPLLVVVTGGLYLLAQTDVLFPRPAINPAEQPQKPKTVPLSQVQDRVLFTVESHLSGPWRVGSLDVYDGKDWRLPPFSESRLADVPRDGVVNHDQRPGVRATFTIAGLGGTVLPGLPNTVGVVAVGPKLAYDDRSGSLRVAQGQVQAGLTYTVAA